MNNKKSSTLFYIFLFIWVLGALFTIGMLNFDYNVAEYFIKPNTCFVDNLHVILLWPAVLGYLIVYFFH